jgi:hypothetical protein
MEPLPATFPVSELAKLEGTGDVTPAASTPNGFKLQNPGIRRDDYVYDSDPVYQNAGDCGPIICTAKAQVKVQFHQVVNGIDSHTWRLTMNMAEYSNPGNLTWTYSSTYWCGINIKLADDQLCDDPGAAPSNETMSVNTVVNKPWGAPNGITVFPMVQATTIFSDGAEVTVKFRGWDTLSTARTTRLNTTSGTGN